MSEPRTVWVTRSAPGSEATSQRLRALGYETVVWPLLTVRAMSGGMINLHGVGALAFTSANAVTAFIRRSLERRMPVFAVGAGTAAAAQAAGFLHVLSAGGDVMALAAEIVAHQEVFSGAVLHPAAVERAADLGAALAPHDIKVRMLAVYETVAAEVPAKLPPMIPGLWAVTLHSAKSARALADILRANPAPRLCAFCLSRAVARPLARIPLARLAAAARPTEEALIDLFRR
ncbi:MAG TPA: uroporphyrinogen-III synthase [Caulobacteraceae bacterium]